MISIIHEKTTIGFTNTKNFRVEEFKKPSKDNIETDTNNKPKYRSKKLSNGDILTFAITKNTGPQGGKTDLTSIKRPKE